jgi:hypothetical protein
MNDDEVIIRSQMHIQLQNVHPQVGGILKSQQGIFGPQIGPAAMGKEQGGVSQSGLIGAWPHSHEPMQSKDKNEDEKCGEDAIKNVFAHDSS